MGTNKGWEKSLLEVPLFNQECKGERIGFRCMVRDVTEREKMEELRQRRGRQSV
jgi:hypothetical protein